MLLQLLGALPAHAIDYTITYDANPNYVGAVSQAGITTGSLPTSPAQASGTIYVVQGQGTLARQGFNFAGWNSAIDGTGSTYSGGSTFVLSSSRTLYAMWSVPVAARLIGNGGTMISVANTNSVTNGGFCLTAGVRGITSDGTYIYFRPSTNIGYICKVTTAGVVVSVNQVVGLENVVSDQLALVYGNGCLFVRKDPLTTFDSIWCIALSNWSLNSISLPTGKNMPTGGGWLNGNFIQFPDGRIGSVGTSVAAATWSGGVGTGAGQCPTSMYCKTLRLYNVSGTGVNVSTTFSTDFILADNVNTWPSDDHGIATDGTYLYQVRHARGYKVWALQSSGPSFVVFNGDADGNTATTPACGATTGVTGTYCRITYPIDGNAASSYIFGNATYFGRSHGLNKYLIGDYDANSKFWLSDAAAPPPGPGNPDVQAPIFITSDTFTVAENVATSVNAATISVSESATMVIAAGGDGSQFTILKADTATVYLRFNASPDYEGPTDTGANNTYDITINATDGAGNTGIRTINIKVTNVIEASTTGVPTISGTVYKGVVISLTVTVNAPGTVRFFLSGKRIQGCLSRPTTGTYPNYIATCQWKPPVIGEQKITATLTPSDNTFSISSSTVGTYWVLKRTTTR
jgi:hypothetical protein